MDGKAVYLIYKELQRGETAINSDTAKVEDSVEHTKGFLECMFVQGQITLDEQMAWEDMTEGLYLEIDRLRKAKMKQC